MKLFNRNPQDPADLYAMVQEFCNCGKRHGEKYTNYTLDHADDCGYRRAMETRQTATREEGFRRRA